MDKSHMNHQPDDIEVTSEMVLAGVYALAGFNSEQDSTFEVAAEVYQAMELVRRCAKPAVAVGP